MRGRLMHVGTVTGGFWWVGGREKMGFLPVKKVREEESGRWMAGTKADILEGVWGGWDEGWGIGEP